MIDDDDERFSALEDAFRAYLVPRIRKAVASGRLTKLAPDNH